MTVDRKALKEFFDSQGCPHVISFSCDVNGYVMEHYDVVEGTRKEISAYWHDLENPPINLTPKNAPE